MSKKVDVLSIRVQKVGPPWSSQASNGEKRNGRNVQIVQYSQDEV